MTGIKMARIRRCHTCPHRSTRHASVWSWPHCDGGGLDTELSDEFMETGECPAGRWDGLDPVDLEAEAKAQAAARLERERETKRPAVLAALALTTDETRQAGYLVQLVELGFLSAALAEEIATEAGLDIHDDTA